MSITLKKDTNKFNNLTLHQMNSIKSSIDSIQGLLMLIERYDNHPDAQNIVKLITHLIEKMEKEMLSVN